MTTTIVTTTLLSPVTLGVGNYGATLSIANGGGVIATPIAVSSYLSGDSLVNKGIVHGGAIGVEIKYGALGNGGTITGATIGVSGQDAFINNYGSIAGGIDGITLSNGGSFDNANAGYVSGNIIGLALQNSSALIFGGHVSGGEVGVELVSSGTLVDTFGTIQGSDGVVLDDSLAGVYVQNLVGYISGSTTGVVMNGGTVYNGGGVIAGGVDGIYISASSYAAHIFNGNEISGGVYAIDAVGSLALTLSTGATMAGNIRDRSGDGLLVLNGQGELGGIGNSVTGFSTIDFLTGATWTLAGTGAGFNGDAVTGFAPGNTLDVTDLAFTTSNAVTLGSSGTLTIGADKITFASADAGEIITLNSDGHAGTDISIVPCFCAGTRIRTPSGQVMVQDLRVGDLVETAFSGPQPIRWIGQRAYEGLFIAGNRLALPIKIRRHALDFNVPSRDLCLSPGHALAEGGVLVHAWRFVNGVSITQAETVERVEYFHIELEHHAVIFAENVPVESFLDIGCRAQFHNAASAPLPHTATQNPCLPQIDDGYYLARLKARIDARAGISPPRTVGRMRGNLDYVGEKLYGWAQDEVAPEIPVELELVFGGRIVGRFLANKFRTDLREAGLGSGCHAFELTLPPFPGALTIRRVIDGAILTAAHKKAA